MANLARLAGNQFILTVFDVRQSIAIHSLLKGKVHLRIHGFLLPQERAINCHYYTDLSLCDTLLVSTSRIPLDSALINIFAQCGAIRFLQKFSNNLALLQYYDSRDAVAGYEYRLKLDSDIKFRLINIDTFSSDDFKTPSDILNAITRTANLDPRDPLHSLLQMQKQITTQTQCQPSDKSQQCRLTYMIRNIPNKYTQDQLLEVLDSSLSRGIDYDFLYLRMDFINRCNVGYAFINFKSNSAVKFFSDQRVGKRWPLFNSEKICSLSNAHIQGRECLIEKFRDSSIMLEDAAYRPRLFDANGQDQEFPKMISMRPKSDQLFTREKASSTMGVKKENEFQKLFSNRQISAGGTKIIDF